MGDVKDILRVHSQAGASTSTPAKKDKPRELPERPKGMSREAYNLFFAAHPITPTTLVNEVLPKKDQKPAPASVQISYQLLPFTNDGRTDDLQLQHWTKCYKDATGQVRPADDGPYTWAAYNRVAGVQAYDDVEYETVIRPKLPESETGWGKEETDHLLDLCQRLDLRFHVIADRWDPPAGVRQRSVEDLKERYYAVAAALAVARAGDGVLAQRNPLVRHRFDAQRERERKAILGLQWSKTKMDVAEEDQVLAEADLIQQRRKEQAAARRPQGAPLLHAASFSNSVSELPFFDAAVIPVCPAKPGVYSRRATLEEALKRAVQQQPQQQARVQRMVDSVMAEVGPLQPQHVSSGPPAMLTRAIMGMRLALHSEVLHLVDMRSRGTRSGSGAGGASVPRPGGTLAGGPPPPDEGRGKRVAKLKAPRYDESPPGIGAKRQRSMR